MGNKILRPHMLNMYSEDDEYYTSYEDINCHFSRILSEDFSVFNGKVIYFPCDDFYKSNFPKWFMDNSRRLGWKSLICTSYTKFSKLLSEGGRGGCVVVRYPDKIDEFSMFGSGDFRSIECQQYFNDADIIITNPPFSLSKDLYPKLLNKKFSVVGLNSDICQGNHIRYSILNGDVKIDALVSGKFIRPDNSIKHVSSGIVWYSNLIGRDYSKSCCWDTMKNNLYNNDKLCKWLNRHKFNDYPITDDGYLYVPIVSAIPTDYDGYMLCSLAYLPYIDRNAFELISYERGDHHRLRGQNLSALLLIRRKCNENSLIPTGKPVGLLDNPE